MEKKKVKESSLERSSGKKKSSKTKSSSLTSKAAVPETDAVEEKRLVYGKRRSVSEKKHPRVQPSKSSDSVHSTREVSSGKVTRRPKPQVTDELVVQRRERAIYSLENDHSSSSIGAARYILTAEEKAPLMKTRSREQNLRPSAIKGSFLTQSEDNKPKKIKKHKEPKASSKKSKEPSLRSVSEIPKTGSLPPGRSSSAGTASTKPTKRDIHDLLEHAHSRGSSPRPAPHAAVELPPRAVSDSAHVRFPSSASASPYPTSSSIKKSSGLKKKSRDRRPVEEYSDSEESLSPRYTTGHKKSNSGPLKSDASAQDLSCIAPRSSGGASSATASAGGLHGSNGSMGSGGGSGGAVAQVAGIDTETRDRALSFTTLMSDPLLASIPPHMVIPASDLVIGSELGQGSFGLVWKGTWRAIPVAIKQCMLFKREMIDEFKREAEMVLRIRPHPNIVQTLGICPDPGRLSIVMEYCEKGSLDKTLSGPKAYPMKKLLRIIKGIAAGVYHLHSENIVHRDLAARNILMAENLPRVADFGFSRAVERDGRGKTNASTGPIKWMAPESLRTKEYSKMSDVWSFGILCYEILAGKEPHADANPTEIGYKIMTAYVTPSLPDNTPLFLAELIHRCWNPNPEDRPSMQEITTILNEKIE